MRRGSVYFFAALTLLSLGLTLVPCAFSQTGQTQNIKVLSYSYYVDSTDSLDVVGEVQNVGPNTVAQVVLAGQIIDSNGVVQADSYTEIGVEQMSLPYLNPQQIAPFYMYFPQPSNSPDGTWGTVDVSSVILSVVQANATTSYQYPDLAVANSNSYIGSTSSDTGVYWVTGNVENTGSQTAQNITVLGTFYNSTGCVIAVGYSDTYANLSPSAKESFKLGAFDINQTGIVTDEKITNYTLLIQADGPILQGTAPLITPSPGPSSSQSPGVTSSPSPTQKAVNSNSNKSSSPAAIYAIIVVIVLAAVAGTILVLRSRKPREKLKEARKARKQSMS
ncbi:MAG: hypothetical protein ABSD92_02700 [Candidatus Bathyarchaeia archaeon]